MEKLLNVLEELCPNIDFEKETNLIDDGLLDSVTVVSIVSELEDVFGIAIGMEYIQPKYFQSAETIWEMIQELQ